MGGTASGAATSSQLVMPLQTSQPPIAVLFPTLNEDSIVRDETSRNVVGSTDNATFSLNNVEGHASLLRVVDEPNGGASLGESETSHGKVSTSAWSASSASSNAANPASQPSNQQPTSTKASTPDPQEEDDEDPDCIVVESDEEDEEPSAPPPKLQGVGRGFRGRRGRFIGVPNRGGMTRREESPLEEEDEDAEEGMSEEEDVDSELEPEEEYEGDGEDVDPYERIDDEEVGMEEEDDEESRSFGGEAESLDEEEGEDDGSSRSHRRVDESDDVVVVEDDLPQTRDAVSVPPLVMTTTSASSANNPAPQSESEDCRVPSTPTLVPAVASVLPGQGAVDAVSSPSVPHTPHGDQGSAKFVFGSSASLHGELSFANAGDLQGSMMDRQMDIGGMIPPAQPVVTSSSTTSSTSFATLATAAAGAVDNEADDAIGGIYHPTPSDDDAGNSAGEASGDICTTADTGEGGDRGETGWRVGGPTNATSSPATSTTSSTVTERARSVSIIPARGGTARRSRGGFSGNRM